MKTPKTSTVPKEGGSGAGKKGLFLGEKKDSKTRKPFAVCKKKRRKLKREGGLSRGIGLLRQCW